MRDAYYRRTFGISADDFDALLAKQGGCCAICNKRPERDASLHLDHCHETGAIRGILCGTCNKGLGLFGEDPELLDAAGRYLREGVTA